MAGDGYREFDYQLYESPPGALTSHGGRRPGRPDNYLTDVLARRASAFVDRSAAAGKPFVIEVATFAPHAPYTVATRDLNALPDLTAPRTPQFDRPNVHAPAWLGRRPPLTASQLEHIDIGFRKRALAVRAVDRLIGRLEQTVAADHLSGDTYFVFSSDNGYHMGEPSPPPRQADGVRHRHPRSPGRRRPGRPTGALSKPRCSPRTPTLIPPSSSSPAGLPVPRVRRRAQPAVPLLLGEQVPVWRHGRARRAPRAERVPRRPRLRERLTSERGNPTTYRAIRLTERAVYVEYADGEHEYYDTATDPYELDNLAAKGVPAALRQALSALENCHASATCWAAAHLGERPPPPANAPRPRLTLPIPG